MFSSGEVLTDMKTHLNFGAPLFINGTLFESPIERIEEQQAFVIDFQMQVKQLQKDLGFHVELEESKFGFETFILSASM